jgi:hypothetical protein
MHRHAVHAEGVRHVAVLHPVRVGGVEAEVARVGRRQRVAVLGCPGADTTSGGWASPQPSPGSGTMASTSTRPRRSDSSRSRSAAAAPVMTMSPLVDVRLQAYVGRAQVRALAVIGARQRMHLVAGRTQLRQHAAPDSDAAPGAVHQHDRRALHRLPLRPPAMPRRPAGKPPARNRATSAPRSCRRRAAAGSSARRRCPWRYRSSSTN